MNEGYIAADQDSMMSLARELANAAQNYQTNYARLDGVIQQVGTYFQGPSADQLKVLYEDKRGIFDGVQKAINEATAYMNEELSRFAVTMDQIYGEYR